MDEAALEAQRVAAGVAGRATIGCVGSATYSLLPPLARALREELPGIDFTFRGEMLVPAQLAALRRGGLDVALLRPPLDGTGLDVRRLRTDRLVVALPEGHPLADADVVRLADLAGEDFIVHAGEGRSVMHAEVVARCRAAGFEPQVRHEVAETSTLVTFVAAGLGVALVPEPVSLLVVAGACHRALADPGPGVDLAVATRREESAVVASVLAVLGRVVGEQ
ncbi:LysR family substrate-binding domain-containing protein [Nocardioides solisilvae]|uniref:LysR family substrate-binding domain-containing protein n=1 Tax=Nocardioides solisilvae TaxID=1542435 RepID=UPI001EF59261|nr:LysR family substrate-binding domain-containing protein [Nocardioides solisilvae]